jgi:predicted Zn-dependent protease
MVNVFNATPAVGLATTVGEQLTAAGVRVGVKSNASVTDTKKTIVFYSTQGAEGAARGVCVALKNSCQIKFTSAYASSEAPLTLVLGADFRVPTAEPAPVEPEAG